MKQKEVWRSIKFPEALAQKIESIAKQERRSFSSQALLFIENELARLKNEKTINDRQEQEAVRE